MWISFGKNIYLIATSPTLWYSSALPKNGRWTQYSTSWPFWQDCYGTFSNKQMVASHPWKQTADQRNEGFLSHGDTPSYIYILLYIILLLLYHSFFWVDFSWKKLSSHWESPMTMETPWHSPPATSQRLEGCCPAAISSLPAGWRNWPLGWWHAHQPLALIIHMIICCKESYHPKKASRRDI